MADHQASLLDLLPMEIRRLIYRHLMPGLWASFYITLVVRGAKSHAGTMRPILRWKDVWDAETDLLVAGSLLIPTWLPPVRVPAPGLRNQAITRQLADATSLMVTCQLLRHEVAHIVYANLKLDLRCPRDLLSFTRSLITFTKPLIKYIRVRTSIIDSDWVEFSKALNSLEGIRDVFLEDIILRTDEDDEILALGFYRALREIEGSCLPLPYRFYLIGASNIPTIDGGFRVTVQLTTDSLAEPGAIRMRPYEEWSKAEKKTLGVWDTFFDVRDGLISDHDMKAYGYWCRKHQFGLTEKYRTGRVWVDEGSHETSAETPDSKT